MLDDDDEYIDEDFVVFADFQSKIPAEVLDEPDVIFKVIGFEDQNPIMQVSSKLFQGTYHSTILQT